MWPETCSIDGGPTCRDQKCSCFRRNAARPREKVAKFRIVINGESINFPSKAACARFLKVSDSTITKILKGEIMLENVKIEPVE